jgi:hypothetical protein
MAKSYRWDDNNGRIIASGGTESDPMTFKDITDYYEANPLPLNYNLPRRYGGKAVITGDTTTFSPTAGDKIAVTINGVLYDNIDISGCTSINNVVTAINNATTAYYNVSGYVVASKDGSGYLVLTVRCEDGDGDITIADGSGTSSTCVAKLFNTAPRTLTLTNSPYELCENNASEWFGLNGMGTPTDDSSAGDFTKGAYSITSQVSSVPTGVNISRVDSASTSTSDRIYVYCDSSSFSTGDEVRIVGTTNFNNVIFKITGKSTGFIYGYCPRYVPRVNETGITGATVIKDLSLCWNYNSAIRASFSPYTGISLCDKFKISAKSDGAGSPKIIGIIIRASTSDPSTLATGFYGAYINVDWDLTSAWQDFEFNIRDMANFAWFPNNSYRGYWGRPAYFYVVFDGLSATENVWIDGMRCTNSNRNPQRISENNYVFTTGLTIPASCWFKDYGFNVRFDVLDTNCWASSVIMYMEATNIGEIQLGDYSGGEKEGGVFIFNHFCIEDTGSLTFIKVQCQGITFMSFKDAYGGFNFSAYNIYNSYRNCNWINMLNFFSSETGSTFENCTMMGYRYAFAFPQAGTTINGLFLYRASNYAFFVRTASSISTIKGVKYIDSSTSNRTLVNSDTYGGTYTGRPGLRLINLDASESGTGLRYAITNYVFHEATNTSPISYVAFSLNLNVTDESGNAISGATVVLKDKDDNQIFSTTTDANGAITEQTVDILKAQNDVNNNTKYFYLDTPTVDWTYYYPYTLTVSKSGYETYTDTLLKDGYSRTNEICKNGYAGKVALKTAKAIIIDTDGDAYFNLDKVNLKTGKGTLKKI